METKKNTCPCDECPRLGTCEFREWGTICDTYWDRAKKELGEKEPDLDIDTIELAGYKRGIVETIRKACGEFEKFCNLRIRYRQADADIFRRNKRFWERDFEKGLMSVSEMDFGNKSQKEIETTVNTRTPEERALAAYPAYTTICGYVLDSEDHNAPLRAAYIAGIIDQQNVDGELIRNMREEFTKEALAFLGDRLFPSVKVVKVDQIDVINRDDLLNELRLFLSEKDITSKKGLR